ncbi:uncharacterized protein LOC144647958 [Oculina patagonica]
MTTPQVIRGTPSNDELEELSLQIGASWRTLGRRLRIEEAILYALERENVELSEQVYWMLLHWKQNNGLAATYKVLYDSLNTVAEASDSTVPPEIRVQGREAVLAFQNAMRNGKVKVHRGRIMLIGQAGAGKTKLKKSLVGIPFDPREDSTEGIEVDPSKFEVEVDQVKNWQLTEEKKPGVSQFSEDIAMIIAKDLKETEAYQDSPEEQEGNNLLDDDSVDLTQQEDADIDLDVGTTTDFQKNVMQHVVEYLKHLKLKNDNKAEEYILSLWDFAGQHLYYASHHVFMSPRALFILVCNLSKDLNKEAEPYFVQGVNEKRLENPNQETNLDNLLSWLVSVHSIRPTADEIVKGPGNISYLRPPVFIVGTHADTPVEDVEQMFRCVQKSLTKKKYQEHVVRPLFSVENKYSLKDDGVQALRKKILEVLNLEPYMKEELPIRWFHFEKIVEALVKRGTYHIQLGQLETVIKKVCRIRDKTEVEAMLEFYHNLGVIVKHGSTVVLQAQWLIDLFKQLITVPPFDKGNPLLGMCWDELEESGILKMELVDHVFAEPMRTGLPKQDILNLMEIFGLIGKFLPDSETGEQRYYVPAQLASSSPGLNEINQSACDPCPLYLDFLDGFVPHGLFHQLVSRCIGWCNNCGFKVAPDLYNGGATLYIGKEPIYNMFLICRKRFIKVILKQMDPSSTSLISASVEMEPFEVHNNLDRILADLKCDLFGFRNLRYEWCVACNSCLETSYKCKKHSADHCSHDDCLHLLKVKEEKMICKERKFCTKTVTVPGLEKWFQIRKKHQVEGQSVVNQQPMAESFVDQSTAKIKSSCLTSQDSKRIKLTLGHRVKSGTPTDNELEKLSHKLGDNWKRLGRQLLGENVEAQIQEFDREVHLNEKAYQMLLFWKQRDATAASYQVLFDALSAVNRVDLAEALCLADASAS